MKPAFPEAQRALAEVRRIISERAIHPKWILGPGAIDRQDALATAEEILDKCVKITYFETNE